MDIRQLEYCAAVARYQNFTKAAESLFVSRQALSKSIKQLEKELGNDLFILKNNQPALTDFGETFLRDSTGAIQEFEKLCQKYSGPLGGQSVFFTIALVHGSSFSVPWQVFDGLQNLDPNIKIAIESARTEDALEMVRKGEAEMGIVGSCPEYLEEFDYLGLACFGIHINIIQGHPLEGRKEIRLEELDGFSFVTAGPHDHLHRYFLEACEKVGIAPEIIMTSSDTTTLVNASITNNALCFGFPREVYPDKPDIMEVSRLVIEGSEVFGSYAVKKKGDQPSAALKKVWDYLEELAPNLVCAL